MERITNLLLYSEPYALQARYNNFLLQSVELCFMGLGTGFIIMQLVGTLLLYSVILRDFTQ